MNELIMFEMEFQVGEMTRWKLQPAEAISLTWLPLAYYYGDKSMGRKCRRMETKSDYAQHWQRTETKDGGGEVESQTLNRNSMVILCA